MMPYMEAPGLQLRLFSGVRGSGILRTSPVRSSEKFALRGGLLLDHRFRWLRGGYGVSVAMHNLPHAFLGSEDHRDPKSGLGDILPSADLGLHPLYPHRVGELGSHVLRHGLAVQVLAISHKGGGTLYGRSNLL